MSMTEGVAALPLPPFHIAENFLPREEHQALLALALESEEAFNATTVYDAADEVVRQTQRTSRKLLGGLGPLKAAFSDRARAAAPALFAATGVKPLPIERLELELVAHNDGDHFGRHIDTLTGKTRETAAEGGTARTLSAVYYFYREPKSFSGGELRLHRFGSQGGDGNHLDIAPEQNRLLAFPSFASHEVLPVICPSGRFEDSRFTVNCWFHCRI